MDKTYKIQEDDICLVAYPKSGNNFLLFLVTMLLYRKKMDWSTKGEMIQTANREPTKNLPSPHLVWSHQSYDATYPKVLYLVRDPRDVVVSYYYHYQKYYGYDSGFDEFFKMFMNGKVGRGMWDQNVESWIDNQEKIKNGFLLVRYEDLLKNTTREANRIVNFLNLKRTKKEIKEAVNWASFDNMKSLEKKQKTHLNGDSPFANHNLPFVRQGQANKWKSVLSKKQEQTINQKFEKTMTKLGYEI